MFGGLLNLSTNNTQIIYKFNIGKIIPRREFIITLIKELAKPHLSQRASVDCLQVPLKNSIKAILGTDYTPQQKTKG